MKRYLLFYNYVGTRFKGYQKQNKRLSDLHCQDPATLQSYFLSDRNTIQGALEGAFWSCFKPRHPLVFHTSCRTDTGVHAFCNTGTIDLDYNLCKSFTSEKQSCESAIQNTNSRNRPIESKEITASLNNYFCEQDLDIRIQKCLEVNEEFSARRSAIGRSYLYRIALVNESIGMSGFQHDITQFKDRRRRSLKYKIDRPIAEHRLNIFDKDRFYQVQNKMREKSFDLDKFKSSLALMEGNHNFKSFCSSSGWEKHVKLEDGGQANIPREDDEFVKTIHRIDVSEQFPVSQALLEYSQHINFYDVRIDGVSFLHNQIRRMIGMAVSTAHGLIDLNDVEQSLNNPNSSWNPQVKIAPPHGLYLLKVDYGNQLDHLWQQLHS